MNNAEFVNRLEQLTQTVRNGFTDFARKSIPTASEILGVPMSLLRKEVRNADLSFLTDNTFEEQILKAILIGRGRGIKLNGANVGQDEHLAQIAGFVPNIHDWAVCDCLAGECKFMREASVGIRRTAKDRAKYFDFVLSLNKGGEFDGRIALTILNNHFIDGEYIDRILQFAEKVSQDFYYTKMAAAWLIATCCGKFPDRLSRFCNGTLCRFGRIIRQSKRPVRVTE
jgi:3-methyladenine DNA glycosylase AlkD